MFNKNCNNFEKTNYTVVFSAQGDVTGDAVPDNVYLKGIQTIDSPFIQDITLVINDGRTGKSNCISLESNAGYNPTLFLGNFTGDRVKEILISIASGGSGGIMFYYIYSDVENAPRLLFDYNTFNEEYQYKVNYKDYYKVEVKNITDSIKYIIDISNKDKDYLKEIYDLDGKLKEPIEGFVSPLSGLYPIDFDTNGVYELLAYQRVSGRYAADALGYIQTVLKWNGKKFALDNQFIAIFGTDVDNKTSY